jgi:hypothetical protein
MSFVINRVFKAYIITFPRLKKLTKPDKTSKIGLQSPALDDRRFPPISFPLQIKINLNEKKFRLGVDNVKQGIHKGQAKRDSMADIWRNDNMANRVMRLNNNPNARGFIVRVLEESHRDELGNIHFNVVASETAGTKAKANTIYDRLRAEHIN